MVKDTTVSWQASKPKSAGVGWDYLIFPNLVDPDQVQAIPADFQPILVD